MSPWKLAKKWFGTGPLPATKFLENANIQTCRVPKLEVEDAHRFEQSKDGRHPAKAGQPRLRPVEVPPFIK